MPKGFKSALIIRNPIFRSFVSATFVSNLGGNLFDFAIPLYVYEKTHSVFDMSLVYFCLSLPHFLMAPLTGYSADQFNRRTLLIAADVLQVFLLVIMLAPVSDSFEIPLFLVSTFLVKSLAIISETVVTFQLIPALVSTEDLSEANTWFLSAQRIIQIVGPLMGGILMSSLGVGACIIGNMVSFAATLYFSFQVKNLNELIQCEGLVKTNWSASHFVSSFFEGLKYVWTSKVFRPFVFLMFFWNLSPFIPRTTTITFFYTETNQYSAFAYGLILSLVGVLEILAYVVGRRFYRQYPFGKVLVGSAVWQAVMSTAALALGWFFLPSPLLFGLFLGISRMGCSILTMGTFLLRQTAIPRNRSGTVNSCIRMLFMSGSPLSSLAQAFIIHHINVGTSLVFGIACLWAVCWYARSVAHAGHEREKAPARAA